MEFYQKLTSLLFTWVFSKLLDVLFYKENTLLCFIVGGRGLWTEDPGKLFKYHKKAGDGGGAFGLLTYDNQLL